MTWHPEYLGAFALGFFGSLHCLGMCGPIALVVPPLGSGTGGRIAGGLVYSLGRITTYTSLGFIFAIFGLGFVLFEWQQWLSIELGISIILYALIPRFFQFSGLNQEAFGLTNRLKVVIGKRLKKGSAVNLFAIGLANGLLPCGFVYLGLAGSLALGELWHGALFMTFFGLGTVPMMTGIHLIGHSMPAFKTKLIKVLPVFTVLFGLLFILRGLGLGIPYLSPELTLEGHAAGHCIVAGQTD